MRPVNELNKITPNKNIWKIYVHVNIYIYYILCISVSSSWTELLLWQTYSLGHRGQNLSTTKERWDSFHFYAAKPRLPPSPIMWANLADPIMLFLSFQRLWRTRSAGFLSTSFFFFLPPEHSIKCVQMSEDRRCAYIAAAKRNRVLTIVMSNRCVLIRINHLVCCGFI